MTKIKNIFWLAWLIGSIFYAYQYILRVMPSIMMQEIIEQFNINATTFGQFSGVYYIGYAFMHLPLGILLHKYGPKKILPLCILLSVIGIMPIIFSANWVLAVAGRALLGIGSSAAILGLFHIIRFSFNEKQFTSMLSYSVVIGLIGAIYGGAPVNYMCEELGYKNVVIVFSLLGLLLTLFAYLMIPPVTEANDEASVIGDIREVLTNHKVVIFCILAGLMVGPLEGFADIWGPTYLQKVYGFDKTAAAGLPSLMYIGMGFGAPLLSNIADRTNSHLKVVITAAIIMFICLSLFMLIKLPIYLIFPLMFLVGMCSAYQILAIYKSTTYVKDHVVGLTTTFANMMIMLFGYFFHSTIGYLVESFGGKESSAALSIGIGIIPLSLLVSGIGLISISYLERKKRSNLA